MINISDYVRTELMKYDGIYLPKEQKFKEMLIIVCFMANESMQPVLLTQA